MLKSELPSMRQPHSGFTNSQYGFLCSVGYNLRFDGETPQMQLTALFILDYISTQLHTKDNLDLTVFTHPLIL